MIPEFTEGLGFWTKFTFWYVFINIFVTMGFLALVIIGGLFDLRFLMKALREERIDETDDGRVEAPPALKEIMDSAPKR